MGALDVVGPDRHRKTVNRGVGGLDDLILRGEGDHRQHWTEDLLLGEMHVLPYAVEDGRGQLARRLQSGNVSINYPTVNPPEAPFGHKQSGLGRELSRHAMDLYTQTKNVVVNFNPQPFDGYGRWPEAPKP
jgi:hypothetical protein